MWLETTEQRADFERDLAQRTGIDVELLRACRQQLSGFAAGQLVKIWFGKVELPDPVAGLFATLRAQLPTRASLFSWVYGPGSSVARDLLYVKIPSSEKRRLVNLILASSRKRFPWLNSQLIHAIAFRPRAFQDLMPRNESIEPWGPLYRRAAIPKGRGKRYLWIPNPPLKRIQKSLLRLIGPPLDRQMLTCVYGASIGRDAPTFRNAAAHLGKRVIASFDIRDFFPSTRIDDILTGIRFVNRSGQNGVAKMVDPALLPSDVVNSKQAVELAWTHDAEILVARLATFRGRLPQGSPLSPLLANVAFAPYDTAIHQALSHEFGRGEYCYTRYFDDLTISLSSAVARRRTPGELKSCCEQLLRDVLQRTPYSLQRRKSRCSESKAGHNITGVMVYRDHVDLPRKLKRHLRSVVHHLRSGDFVSVARKWYSSRGEMEPKFHSVTRGHRWNTVGLKKRRLSAERLATLMLRQLYPDLKLERLLPDWYPWQETFDRDDTVVEGRMAWAMVEWLLAALWSGEISELVGDSSTDAIVFQQAGVSVCKIMAESSLDFFYLPRDRAIAVVEYWHHLQGLSGYLRSCPVGNEFAAVHKWRDELHDAMQGIRIETTARPRKMEATSTDAHPDTLGGRIEELTSSVLDEYNEFSRRIKCNSDGSLGSRQERFRTDVHDEASFNDWISSVAELIVRRLPRLPIATATGKTLSSEEFFTYIRVKHDQLLNRVSHHYKIVERVEKNIGLQKQSDPPFRKVQHKLLLLLSRYFEVSTDRRRELEGAGPDAWLRELAPNPWTERVERRLMEHVDLLEDLHYQLRTDDSERRLFVQASGRELVSERASLASVASKATSDKCWNELIQLSKIIYTNIYEAIEPAWCTDSPPDGDEPINASDWKRRRVWKRLQPTAGSDVKDRLNLIEQMRNRAAHGESVDRRKEWVWIQRRIRDVLGRSWESKSGPKHPEYHADDDLELWPYEAGLVKLQLLSDVATWLTAIRDNHAWRTE